MAGVRDGAPFGSRSAGILFAVAVARSAAPVRAESDMRAALEEQTEAAQAVMVTGGRTGKRAMTEMPTPQMRHERSLQDAKTSNDLAKAAAQTTILINGAAATALLAYAASITKGSTGL